MQVVRTRRVRAIEERFYGRTARMFYVGVERSPEGEACLSTSTTSRSPLRESQAAYRRPELWGFIRHARIPEEQAVEFWERMASWSRSSSACPRSGETVYGFAVGVYPTDHPILPATRD